MALAWLAGGEPFRGRSGLWPAGEGDRRGRLEAWMARRSVIWCGMFAARVRACWPGPPS